MFWEPLMFWESAALVVMEGEMRGAMMRSFCSWWLLQEISADTATHAGREKQGNTTPAGIIGPKSLPRKLNEAFIIVPIGHAPTLRAHSPWVPPCLRASKGAGSSPLCKNQVLGISAVSSSSQLPAVM